MGCSLTPRHPVTLSRCRLTPLASPRTWPAACSIWTAASATSGPLDAFAGDDVSESARQTSTGTQCSPGCGSAGCRWRQTFSKQLLRVLLVLGQRVEQLDARRQLAYRSYQIFEPTGPAKNLAIATERSMCCGLRRDAEVPGTGVADLRPVLIVGDAGHAVVEIAIRVVAIDRADRVIGADIERRALVEEDLS